MRHVAVVILNWNGRDMLRRFLPSVIDCSGDAEVVVADNGSTDGSLDLLASEFPGVRVVALDKNHGFAEGYNLALRQVEADYYVLLNSDVECTPGWIEPVVDMMECEPRVAVAQPKLMMYDCKDTFEYAGGAGGFIDRYGYPFCRGRLFSTLEKDSGQYDDERDIFWATGACMFVRSDVWREVGGLDGDFFAHMEEIDFCWRVMLAGYRVRYCPSSRVYHVGGGTLPKSSPFKTELNFRNNLSMLYKNLPAGRRGRVLALRMWLDRVAAVKFLMEGHVGEYRAVRKAHREFRNRRGRLDEKRMKNGTMTVPQIYGGWLLPEYYLLRRRRFSDLKGQFSR
ncbi:MAG: glycosyltransferase family 2 protein [Bacteroidales bacterium]|nr:glycosyltransferase family 2 protein [Bacteroidales bacterium]